MFPLRGNALDLLLPVPLGLFLDVWCFFSWIAVEVEVDARVGLSEADNVEADGFDGNEGCGKREDGADTGFSSWRSFASRAAILSSVLVGEMDILEIANSTNFVDSLRQTVVGFEER